MDVATTNVDQANAWNGAEGEHWAEHDDVYNGSIGAHTARLLATAAIAPSERILDIGCGAGDSTRQAARRAPAGSVLGVDLSGPMIERARQRGREEGITNATFEQGDAQVYPFRQEFDLAMSRFGVMFFGDPVAAFTNLCGALKPGGRVAFLVWRELGRNEWINVVRGALAQGRQLPEPPRGVPSPFSLADRDRTGEILRAGGFSDVGFDAVDEPVVFGGTVDQAFDFFSAGGLVRGLLEDLDEPTRTKALDDLRAALSAHLTSEGVIAGSSAWLVTATR